MKDPERKATLERLLERMERMEKTLIKEFRKWSLPTNLEEK